MLKMRKHYLSTVADELASRNWPLNCRAVYECSRDFKVCNSRGSYGGQVGRGGEGSYIGGGNRSDTQGPDEDDSGNHKARSRSG